MKINTDDLYYAIEEVGSACAELEYKLGELENAIMKVQQACWKENIELEEYANSDEAELKDVMKSAYNNMCCEMNNRSGS